MLLVWLLLPGWRIVFMCPILAAVNPGSVQAGKRKFLGPPLRAAGCGKNDVQLNWPGILCPWFACAPVNTRHVCSTRKEASLCIGRERGSLVFNLEYHYHTRFPVNSSKY